MEASTVFVCRGLDWDLKERKLLPYLRSGFREGIAGREYLWACGVA